MSGVAVRSQFLKKVRQKPGRVYPQGTDPGGIVGNLSREGFGSIEGAEALRQHRTDGRALLIDGERGAGWPVAERWGLGGVQNYNFLYVFTYKYFQFDCHDCGRTRHSTFSYQVRRRPDRGYNMHSVTWASRSGAKTAGEAVLGWKQETTSTHLLTQIGNIALAPSIWACFAPYMLPMWCTAMYIYIRQLLGLSQVSRRRNI